MSSLEKTISEIIRPDIQQLAAYAIPDPGEMTKLDAMENPYTWPESLVQQWLQELSTAPVNRYPDPDAKELKERLRLCMDVPSDMDLMLGNGSDEIIQILLLAVCKPGQVVMSPAPSFVMYDMIATFTSMKYVAVPLDKEFDLDMQAMRQAITQHQPAVIFIAYPNNPTGNLFKRQDIEEILSLSKGLVVIDEAYHAFSDTSFMSDLPEHDNLLVMRTVSKMGLAGLRLGMLAGHKKWLTEFNKIRLPYNINVLTQISADFALRNNSIFDDQTAAICKNRDTMKKDLQQLSGITVYPSNANFILFRVANGSSAADIFEHLKEQGVLIKNMKASQGPLKDCLRVTIGTPNENRQFLDALSAII